MQYSLLMLKVHGPSVDAWTGKIVVTPSIDQNLDLEYNFKRAYYPHILEETSCTTLHNKVLIQNWLLATLELAVMFQAIDEPKFEQPVGVNKKVGYISALPYFEGVK